MTVILPQSKLLVFSSMVFVFTCSYSQSVLAVSGQFEKETGPPVSSDISTSTRCVASVLTSPLHWDASDGLWAGGVALGLAGSALLDDEMRSLVRRNHSRFNDDVLVQIGHPYATVLYMGPSALAMYLSGVAFRNQWMRETGQMLVEAVATIGIIQLPLSITVGRARPFFNEGNASLKAFAGWNDDRASFFSGHSMVAFSFSAILSHQIDNEWASVGLYSLAALGPWARLYKDKHWFSDTFFGSALGVFVGNSIWKWHHTGDAMSANIKIVPTGQGALIAWVF